MNSATLARLDYDMKVAFYPLRVSTPSQQHYDRRTAFSSRCDYCPPHEKVELRNESATPNACMTICRIPRARIDAVALLTASAIEGGGETDLANAESD